MFRVKEANDGHSIPEQIVQSALVIALLATLGTGYLILQEHRVLSAVSSAVEISDATVASLRRQEAIQLSAILAISTLLGICIAGIRWLRGRYLSSQRSLRQVKMLAHDILASMDRGVVTTNCEGIITSINSAAIHLLGVDFECVGQHLSSLPPAAAPLVDICQTVIGKKAAVRFRDLSIARHGRHLRLHLDGHVLKDTGGKVEGCALHLRDVTEHVLMEERMRRMERFLSLATLASGLHHEIKNPLTALSIHIQLLEESLSNEPTSDAVHQIVEVLKTEVSRLNGVLESFRSFANLQQLTVQPVDARELVENIVRLVRPQAAERHVEVTVRQPETPLPPVALDSEKLEQAILNLVINALEAMPKGGNLAIGMGVADGEFRVSVQDSGAGIPPEIQAHLFQPYFTTKDQGSGMGLALSEKLISQHGGHIAYRTGPQGTTFEIIIPLPGTA